MMLMEEGKLRLDDPIVEWAPELANRRVLKDPAGPIDDTFPTPRDITIEDLLTHRSGFAEPFTSRGAIADAYERGAQLDGADARAISRGVGDPAPDLCPRRAPRPPQGRRRAQKATSPRAPWRPRAWATSTSLGPHRLICDSSTDPKTFRTLTAGYPPARCLARCLSVWNEGKRAG